MYLFARGGRTHAKLLGLFQLFIELRGRAFTLLPLCMMDDVRILVAIALYIDVCLVRSFDSRLLMLPSLPFSFLRPLPTHSSNTSFNPSPPPPFLPLPWRKSSNPTRRNSAPLPHTARSISPTWSPMKRTATKNWLSSSRPPLKVSKHSSRRMGCLRVVGQ